MEEEEKMGVLGKEGLGEEGDLYTQDGGRLAVLVGKHRHLHVRPGSTEESKSPALFKLDREFCLPPLEVTECDVKTRTELCSPRSIGQPLTLVAGETSTPRRTP